MYRPGSGNCSWAKNNSVPSAKSIIFACPDGFTGICNGSFTAQHNSIGQSKRLGNILLLRGLAEIGDHT
jgi:hypothetical protein